MLKKIVSILTVLSFCTGVSLAVTFKDLKSSAPQYPAVMNMVNEYKAISGYPAGTFKGTKKITRAEFSKIMTNSLNYLEGKYGKIAEEPTAKEANFKDLKSSNWAYPFIADLLTKYQLVTGYPDGTFKPTRNISRYELASLLGKAMKLIYGAYDLSLPQVKTAAFKDVKSNHWAMKDIQLLVQTGVMQSSRQKTGLFFNWSTNATRFDVAVSIDKLIRLVEKAKQPKEDKKEAAPKAAPILGKLVKRSVELAAKPGLYLTGGWGNIYESASGTNNWMGFGLEASYVNLLDFWFLHGNWELTGKYGFNQINYLIWSGGSLIGTTPNENRFELEFNTIYPLVRFFGITGKALIGAKYVNLNNSSTTTDFTGLNLGVVTSLNLFSRDVLARLFYSLPLSRGASLGSVQGQPQQIINYEAAIDANLFSYPVLLGYGGEAMAFSGGAIRYYNLFFVRYFLF